MTFPRSPFVLVAGVLKRTEMVFSKSNRSFKNTSSSWFFEFDAVFKFIFIFATGLIAAEELIYYVIWFKF